MIEPTEEVHPDHRDHAKAPKHPDDTELDARTEHERAEVDADRDEPTCELSSGTTVLDVS